MPRTASTWRGGRTSTSVPKPGLRQGADLFRQALALDSAYAPAWAGLADALTLLASYGHAAHDDVVPEAVEAARHALRIDPGLAEAHA